jgi:hypothetical protein
VEVNKRRVEVNERRVEVNERRVPKARHSVTNLGRFAESRGNRCNRECGD